MTVTEGATSYQVSPSIRHAEADGLQVLLDLERQSYRVLDEAASTFWSVLIGQADRTATLDAIVRSYGIGSDEAEAELAVFAERCLAEGLLRDPIQSASLTAAAAPHALAWVRAGALRAWLCLAATRRALVRDGFRRTYERYAVLPASHGKTHLDLALAAFVRAENAFISRRAPDDCLVRSLALYRFLRGTGHGVRHVIGVHRRPFVAHAWVEQRGIRLLDAREGRFTPLASIGG